MSEFFDPSEVNVRSPRYLIARTTGWCPHCGNSNPLLAVCLPPGHEAFELDEDAPDESNDGIWTQESRYVLLFHVYNLSEPVQQRLRELAPRYDFGHSEKLGSQWANHCEGCGRQLDDSELFCEPDGAFCPTSRAAAILIRLSSIDEPLEAGAAGFAHEPEFFGSMSRC